MSEYRNKADLERIASAEMRGLSQKLESLREDCNDFTAVEAEILPDNFEEILDQFFQVMDQATAVAKKIQVEGLDIDAFKADTHRFVSEAIGPIKDDYIAGEGITGAPLRAKVDALRIPAFVDDYVDLIFDTATRSKDFTDLEAQFLELQAQPLAERVPIVRDHLNSEPDFAPFRNAPQKEVEDVTQSPQYLSWERATFANKRFYEFNDQGINYISLLGIATNPVGLDIPQLEGLRDDLIIASNHLIDSLSHIGDLTYADQKFSDALRDAKEATLKKEQARVKDALAKVQEEIGEEEEEAEQVVSPEEMQRSWVQFQSLYLVKEAGMPPEFVGKTTPEAKKARARAFVKWIRIKWWEDVGDEPDPFTRGYDLINLPLTEIQAEGPTLLTVVDNGREVEAIRILHGLVKMLVKGADASTKQLDPEAFIEGHDDLKVNTFNHLFALDEWPTGEFSGGEIIQLALMAVSFHCPTTFAMYRRLVEGQLAPGSLDRFIPPDPSDPKSEIKHGGLALRDILYKEEEIVDTNIQRKALNFIADWLIAQDEHFHPKSKNPLTRDDAIWAVVVAYNIAEYLGVIGAADPRYTSKRMYASRLFTAPYRKNKGGDKAVGREETYHIFTTLLTPLLETNLVRGVSLKQMWLMTGWVNERIREAYGLQEKITKLELRDEGAAQAPGTFQMRLGGFAERIWKVLQNKESLVEDWLNPPTEDKKVAGFRNSCIAYFWNGVNRGTVETYDNEEAARADGLDPRVDFFLLKGESEEDFWHRNELQRRRYAMNGLILVRCEREDRFTRQKKTKKNGELEISYYFTPVLSWRNFYRDEALEANVRQYFGLPASHKVGPIDIIKYANGRKTDPPDENYKRWQEVQKSITQGMGSEDLIERVQVLDIKWLIIDEMARQKDDFRKLKKRDADTAFQTVEKIFDMLCQDSFNRRYMYEKDDGFFSFIDASSRNIELAPFGRFTIDDVIDILKVAGWVDLTLLQGDDKDVATHVVSRDTVFRSRVNDLILRQARWAEAEAREQGIKPSVKED